MLAELSGFGCMRADCGLCLGCLWCWGDLRTDYLGLGVIVIWRVGVGFRCFVYLGVVMGCAGCFCGGIGRWVWVLSGSFLHDGLYAVYVFVGCGLLVWGCCVFCCLDC